MIKKVKVNQYLSFDLFLSDIKSTFTVLRQQESNLTATLGECENAVAKELQSLIKMDYFATDADSDTSDSIVPPPSDTKNVCERRNHLQFFDSAQLNEI